MNDYINAKLTDSSSTYRTPTEEDVKKEIIRAAMLYSGNKWYEEKAYLLKRMKHYCKILNIIDLSIRALNHKE